jgi:hypothetical protein
MTTVLPFSPGFGRAVAGWLADFGNRANGFSENLAAGKPPVEAW